MGDLAKLAENVEIDLQTSTISDPTRDETAPAKPACKSGRAKASTTAPALQSELDGSQAAVAAGDQTIADYMDEKIAGDNPACTEEFEERQLITALRLNQAVK